MAKKSGSKKDSSAQFDGIVRGLKRDAAPAMAKALNLDSAEAVEAAMNAGVELMLAMRAFIVSLPMPSESRAHLERAEAETLRAARMAAKGLSFTSPRKRPAPAKEVRVDFSKPGTAKSAGKRAKRTRK